MLARSSWSRVPADLPQGGKRQLIEPRVNIDIVETVGLREKHHSANGRARRIDDLSINIEDIYSRAVSRVGMDETD
jgi:hypothetical protein